jgi:hypothetical protein
MPTILRDLPFSIAPSTAFFQGRYVTIKSDQIIIWVGITEQAQSESRPALPFLPAIIDIGHNHNFSIREEHLIRWAGLDPRCLGQVGAVQIGSDRLSLLQADLWLRPNAREERDRPADRAPFRLDLDSGIAVYPPGMSYAPRLPIFGLRALRWAKFHLTVDGRRRPVTLRTTRRPWFFRPKADR